MRPPGGGLPTLGCGKFAVKVARGGAQDAALERVGPGGRLGTRRNLTVGTDRGHRAHGVLVLVDVGERLAQWLGRDRADILVVDRHLSGMFKHMKDMHHGAWCCTVYGMVHACVCMVCACR